MILYRYMPTIWLCVGYYCLIWVGVSFCHIDLDWAQKRAPNFIFLSLASTLQPISHRRKVASLIGFYIVTAAKILLMNSLLVQITNAVVCLRSHNSCSPPPLKLLNFGTFFLLMKWTLSSKFVPFILINREPNVQRSREANIARHKIIIGAQKEQHCEFSNIALRLFR